jgi:hypothetical protein
MIRGHFFLLSVAAILFCGLIETRAASAGSLPDSRWVGELGVDGRKDADKMVLVLDDGHNSLVIQGGRECRLEKGTSAMSAPDEWTLTFAADHGSYTCEKMSHGHFLLKKEGPRKMLLDASYVSNDGEAVHRHGELSRYP